MSQLEFNDNQTEERITWFAEVILPLHLNKSFSYRVPNDMVGMVQPGQRVVVQFGKRKIYSGIVRSLSDKPPVGYEAKYILHVLDDEPLVGEMQLRFWDWISQYYMSPIGDVMNAALPSALKLESESIIKLNEGFDESVELSAKEETLLQAIQAQKDRQLTLGDVSDVLNIKNVFPVVRSLFNKGFIIINEEIKERYKPKTRTAVELNEEVFDTEGKIKTLFDSLEKRAPRQLDVLLNYYHLKNEREAVFKDDIAPDANAKNAFNALLEKKAFTTHEVVLDRLYAEQKQDIENVLNEAQQKVYTQLKDSLAEKDVALLHGITGSGKTHLYFELIRETIAQQKQVLYLLPEIALTVQLVSRLRAHFGEQVIVSHSRFNEQERVEIWNKTASGIVKVIVGPRSAVFLPFNSLGLVLVDEEHENSFKQNDPAPRYQGRDAAIYLAHLWNCKTVLGSATPSVDTFYNVQSGKYGYVKLEERFGEARLPQVTVVDVADAGKKNLLKGAFTVALLDEIKQRVQQHEQVILFQNRKGFVPVTTCKTCGWVPKCQNCDISLTYYKFLNAFRCQYCGYQHAPFPTCQACGSHHLEIMGYGTERIEEELNLMLPDARTERFDLENTKTKNAYYRIIRDYENGNIDILVGTQMVTKGLDFDEVSLVGIMDADQLLHQPDFRANERAFYLMSQVAGRAGRRSKPGEVVLQTRRPYHPTVQNVINHDYQSFYTNEIAERFKFGYPPYTKLINLRIKHKEADRAEHSGHQLAGLLRERIGDRVLGPHAPYISRIKNLYIRNILVKIEREKVSVAWVKESILQAIDAFMQTKENRSTLVQVDVDPYF